MASTSDGETTSAFGPLLIRVIRMTPGCSSSHPLSPYTGGKENFLFWLLLEGRGEPVRSIDLFFFTG